MGWALAVETPTRRSVETRDEDLLAAIASGDMTAFETFYARHAGAVLRFATRIANRPELAEEATNDTFMVIWKSAAAFQGRSRVTTWMFGIAYRTALKAHRRNGAARAEVELDDQTPGGEDGAAAIEALFQKRELEQALAQLPAEQRAVVELTYFNGFAYADIADIQGCPVGTVKTRMLHARRRLRDLLTAPESPAGKDRT